MSKELSLCPGCGAALPRKDGPAHRYMESSPACYELFNRILAAEYSDASLLATHRLTVDTYAIQHPGSGKTRREIQSVGLHLARLSLQLGQGMSPEEANAAMIRFGAHKSSLIHLEPPRRYRMTVSDVEPHIGGPHHSAIVEEWAKSTFRAWSCHHEYIEGWIEQNQSPAA